MDDSEGAFTKLKKIIREVVNNQPVLQPMFDMVFTNLPDYPKVQRRLSAICDQIAPRQLFH